MNLAIFYNNNGAAQLAKTLNAQVITAQKAKSMIDGSKNHYDHLVYGDDTDSRISVLDNKMVIEDCGLRNSGKKVYYVVGLEKVRHARSFNVNNNSITTYINICTKKNEKFTFMETTPDGDEVFQSVCEGTVELGTTDMVVLATQIKQANLNEDLRYNLANFLYY